MGTRLNYHIQSFWIFVWEHNCVLGIWVWNLSTLCESSTAASHALSVHNIALCFSLKRKSIGTFCKRPSGNYFTYINPTWIKVPSTTLDQFLLQPFWTLKSNFMSSAFFLVVFVKCWAGNSNTIPISNSPAQCQFRHLCKRSFLASLHLGVAEKRTQRKRTVTKRMASLSTRASSLFNSKEVLTFMKRKQ